MRSILEKAITHLLNEENEQAEALFHKFMVERARQIHESLRSGDDALMESYDDVSTDEMFTEDDLSGLEDEASDEATDDVAAGGDDFGGEDDAAATDASDDFGGDDAAAGDDLGGDDLGGDLGGEEGEGSTEDRISDLEDQLKDLEAQFHELMGTEAAGDDFDAAGDDLGGDLGGDDMGGEFGGDDDTLGGEVDGDMDSAEGGDMASGMEDDMNDAPMSEGENPFAKKDDDKDCDEDDKEKVEEDFDDITESVLSELEKVMVSMTDGKEIAAGKSFSQNNKSPALQKKPNPMSDGKPVQIKASEHKGFERETAPAVKDMKKRKNTKNNAEDGQSKVSKEGDKSALINKTPGAEAQTHSPLAKR